MQYAAAWVVESSSAMLRLNLHVNLNPRPCSESLALFVYVRQVEDSAGPAANLEGSTEGDSSLYDEGSQHRPVGCMGLLESLSERLHIGQDSQPSSLQRKSHSRRHHPQQLHGITVKPEAGASLRVRFVRGCLCGTFL